MHSSIKRLEIMLNFAITLERIPGNIKSHSSKKSSKNSSLGNKEITHLAHLHVCTTRQALQEDAGVKQPDPLTLPHHSPLVETGGCSTLLSARMRIAQGAAAAMFCFPFELRCLSCNLSRAPIDCDQHWRWPPEHGEKRLQIGSPSVERRYASRSCTVINSEVGSALDSKWQRLPIRSA